MTDYIDREAFLGQYMSLYCYDCDRRKNANGKIVYEIGDAPCRACDIGNMLDAVEGFPAADVVEVKHGRWELIDGAEPRRYGCSECKILVWMEYNYCPNCGAKMKG